MGTRIELQNIFEKLLNSRNVYYQTPENLKMKYPAIRYSKTDINTRYGDNIKYSSMNRYNVIVIDESPDNPVIQKILEMPYATYERHYSVDNLNHDVITLYF